MDWAVFSIILAIGILGIGLATLMLHLHKLQTKRNDSFEEAQNQRFNSFEEAQNQRFDSFEKAQNQRFDSFEKAQNQRFDSFEKIQSQRFNSFEKAQNQRFNDFKESQVQIQKVQSEKFDILITEQRKITEQLTNHVAHLQEKQDQMQKDIDDIKRLLQSQQALIQAKSLEKA